MNKTKTEQTLESYYQTENDWHNSKIVELIAAIKEKSNFEELQPALDLYNLGIGSFTENPDSPIKVIKILDKRIHQLGLNETQSVFILEKIKGYLQYTSFEDNDIEEDRQELFMKIFNAEIKAKKSKLEKDKPKQPNVDSLRVNLKEILHKELEKLPEYLEGLEPRQKLNYLCKLMPYVLPKVQTVDSEKGENEFNFGMKW